MVDVMLLFGSGGHSTEMLLLAKSAKLANNTKVKKLICVISEDDKLIGQKIDRELNQCEPMREKLETVTLRRGRRVGQSFLTAIITFGRYYKCDIVYIESFCRTRTLSLSGKLIYHFRLANEFYVQWPTLSVLYPKAKYKGMLV